MQENNPYAAPSSNLGGQDSYGEQGGGVTQGVVRELTGTKGWTRFIGVIMILGAVGIVAAVAVGQRYMGDILNAVHFPVHGEEALAILLVIAVVAAIFVAIYGILLNSFSSAINRLEQTGAESDLASALNRQRAYWIYSGIMSIIMVLFALYGLIH
jgi:hypothetical protein